MAHKKHRAAAHEEEHENHERWLITYADMITLLMVLFVVLFSIGQVDLAKFQALKHSLANSLGGPVKPNPVVTGGAGVLASGSQISGAVPDGSGSLGAPISATQADIAFVRVRAAEQTTFNNVAQQISQALAAKGLQHTVTFRQEVRGLVVTVVTDNVLYPVGSAQLQSEGRTVLDTIAPVLAGLPNDIAIEGHTDNQPIIGGGPYPTNWELSTARATSVLRYLIDIHHLEPSRLSAAGYADTRPLVPNTSPANQAVNRRVEIVVLSQTATLNQTGPADQTGSANRTGSA
jgi:chemotaxis protein MotB